ncbi:MarR family transcriptional regulator [Staphylococcus simulans]|uniref:MarR family transcriptional regulator n=1 Tax=Staphylococcus simulans TaxID=1286 RepID=UPI002DBA318A|nr:MarR family transcriptional regulator [Staphylococcus simulans]MEB6838017.1 replication initiator protein A [Staphylococcus simulans]
MENNTKNRIVNDKVISEYYKYYKFLSYETFTDIQTKEQIKLQKNSKLVYTMLANQFARLVKTNHFITRDDNKQFVKFNAEKLGESLGITRQTVMTKIKQLMNLGLLEKEGTDLIHVPTPNVRDSRSTFIDQKGVARLTYAQIPKYLIDHAYYKDLNENSIIYYALVKERHMQSIQNNRNNHTYVDNHGNTCCWFTNDEACSLLGINEDTLKKDRNLLYAKGLLKSKRFGKALAHYAYEPVNLPEEEVPNNKASKETSQSKTLSNTDSNEKLGVSNLKVGVEEFEKLGLSNTGFSNTYISKTDSNDMYDMYNSNNKENIQKPNSTNHNSAILDLNRLQKESLVKVFPDLLASYLMNFKLNEIEIIKRDMLKGKAAYLNELQTIEKYGLFIQYSRDVEYSIEMLESSLIHVLIRLNQKRKDNKESIEDLSNTGYIFTSFKNEFIKAYNAYHNDADGFKTDLEESKVAYKLNFRSLHKPKKRSATSDKDTQSFERMNQYLDELGVY